jgi:Holliday junction resolvase RusA-like endonuclease
MGAGQKPQEAQPEIRMTHTLTIPNYLPPSLNDLLSGNHWSRHKKKRECRELIAGYCWEQAMAKATGKRRVSLLLTLGPRNRRRDEDNVWKAILDALVHVGLLVDDASEWCELGTVTYARGPNRCTTVTLEEVDDGKGKSS